MDLSEGEVVESERIAPKIREAVMQSGDEKLAHIQRILPEECLARLAKMFVDSGALPGASVRTDT